MAEQECWCLKCRKFVSAEGENSIDKRGRLFFKGKCPTCGGSVRRYLSKEHTWKEE